MKAEIQEAKQFGKGGTIQNEDVFLSQITELTKALECDGAVRVIHHLLNKMGADHKVMAGYLETSQGVIPLHFWIELPDGRIIDVKSRMWLGDEVQQGIFIPDQNTNYVGEQIEMQMSDTMFDILTKFDKGGAVGAYMPLDQETIDLLRQKAIESKSRRYIDEAEKFIAFDPATDKIIMADFNRQKDVIKSLAISMSSKMSIHDFVDNYIQENNLMDRSKNSMHDFFTQYGTPITLKWQGGEYATTLYDQLWSSLSNEKEYKKHLHLANKHEQVLIDFINSPDTLAGNRKQVLDKLAIVKTCIGKKETKAQKQTEKIEKFFVTISPEQQKKIEQALLPLKIKIYTYEKAYYKRITDNFVRHANEENTFDPYEIYGDRDDFEKRSKIRKFIKTSKSDRGDIVYVGIIDDLEEKIKEYAMRDAEQEFAGFRQKMFLKLSGILTGCKIPFDVELVYDNSLDQNIIRFNFSEGSHFSMYNDVKVNYSKFHKPFYQYPTLFKNVELSSGVSEKLVSEKDMGDVMKKFFD